jgi:hypothetical protein
LFADGATIVGPLTASATTVQVSDASRFTDLAGYYAMIWENADRA